MATVEASGHAKQISAPYRVAAGLIGTGTLLAAFMMALSWWYVAGASIVWLAGSLGMLANAGLFGYASITGRSPMRQDQPAEE